MVQLGHKNSTSNYLWKMKCYVNVLKATVYCNHLFINFTKALLKLFMEILRGRKLSSLICRGLNHNKSLSSRMKSKCTNYKANKCAKLLLQEVSIWAYYNGR